MLYKHMRAHTYIYIIDKLSGLKCNILIVIKKYLVYGFTLLLLLFVESMGTCGSEKRWQVKGEIRIR